MRHIDEVLRLAAQGLSQHEISTSLGISRTSVHNYLERARQAGLSWPLPKDLDAAGLEARLFKRTDEGSPNRSA
jgi:predicted transcriptional regulator